jgi:hypothetical protein
MEKETLTVDEVVALLFNFAERVVSQTKLGNVGKPDGKLMVKYDEHG